MLSSQMLWPLLCSIFVAFISSPRDRTSRNPPRRFFLRRGVRGPQAISADDCFAIVDDSRARGRRLEQLGVAATDHQVLGVECILEPLRDISHAAPPFLNSGPLQTTEADVILVGAPLFVRQMSELGRFHGTVDYKRGAQTGTQAEKQHPAAAI